MDAIAPGHPAHALWRDLAARLAHEVESRRAHPARTVVLLPYIQLLGVARQCWAQRMPSGFAPRFETVQSWAAQAAFEPSAGDFSGDAARDLLSAQRLIADAGLGAEAEPLAPRLVEAAAQLAPQAAAVLPAQRPAWAQRARQAAALGLEAEALRLEAAIARLAVEWVAQSAYASDGLFMAEAQDALDLLVVVQGLRPDPVQAALVQRAGERGAALSLVAQGPPGTLALHEAGDVADEAGRAAACVIRHLQAGRTPVALAATDRVLTRRVAALLQQAGVPLRDEQGWKLSTTRRAADLMAMLQACAWDANTDAVLDWLKQSPGFSQRAASALERRVRRANLRDWRSVREDDCGDGAAVRELFARANALRERLQAPRALGGWLAALREALEETGLWPLLQRDAAGAQVVAALRLDEGAGDEFDGLTQAGTRLTLAQFRTWADEVLEAAQFRPPAEPGAVAVILPFGQTLGRPFAAMVLPGCDEARLPASPEPAGPWTPVQRPLLGLRTREQAQAEQAAAWQQALQMPCVDILWRIADDNGEPLLPSPLVQALMLTGGATLAADPREARTEPAAPVGAPQVSAPRLPLAQLSASAYEDLRRCPYRFFAMRLAGLREADEVEAEVDKRDFGNWLHNVLREFHETARDPAAAPDERAALLDAVAARRLAALRLEDGEFLPFEAGWPGVRDAYLAWLATHEGAGARFVSAETEHQAEVAGVRLLGRIDRIDATATGGKLLVDYKTEGLQATRDRVKLPAEDTQLAFYATLMGDEPVEAAYLNISERGEVHLVACRDIEGARELMRAGIADEFARIAEGAVLPALGEGRACEFCAARGLCRKDSWS